MNFSIFALSQSSSYFILTFFLITKEIDLKTTEVNGIRKIGFSPIGLLLVIQDN